MQALESRQLLTLKLKVDPEVTDLGDTPFGRRLIAHVLGGTFTGPRLSGTVVSGGGDWILKRGDGVVQLDVRIALETEDGARIYMSYRGLRHGSPDAMERHAAGEYVAPEEYYVRITPVFETGANTYAWLNRLVAVGVGYRASEGPVYEVNEIL